MLIILMVYHRVPTPQMVRYRPSSKVKPGQTWHLDILVPSGIFF